MGFIFGFILVIFLLVTFLLCSVVLVQESKGMGLGASFGGDVKESLFGTSTAAVLKKITGYLAAAFMILCIFLSLWTSSLARAKAAIIPEVEVEDLQ